MSQIKFKFIEAIAGLQTQNKRLENGDTLLTALGKLQGQFDAATPVYIQAVVPADVGPYVWYDTSVDPVREFIHDGFADVLDVGGFALSVSDGFVLGVS